MKRLETKGEGPTKRAAHSMTKVENQLWIFGGNCDIEFFNDMYCYSIKSLTWSKIAYKNITTDTKNIPSPRAGHTMDIYEKNLVVFGGGNRTEFFEHLFFFNYETFLWELKITKVFFIISSIKGKRA